MVGGFRGRLVATMIGLVLVTAAVVAVTSYVLVERSLRDQLVIDAVDRAEFNVGVLASEDVLPADALRADFESSGLAERFLQRGAVAVYVEFDGSDDAYASEFALFDAGEQIEPQLRALVAQGRYGYQFIGSGSDSQLIVGGRRPDAGPDFYFFFSAAEVDAALVELRRVLLFAGGAVAVLGALVAGLVARGVLRPVRNAGVAARRIAGGDLSVRLPVESRDEFGVWAESFNTMAASLEAKIDELQAARAREERFVADVSHELRTPLTALVTEAEMLQAHLDDMPPSARRVSELLSHDVSRLRRLVADLLEISRLDAAVSMQGTDEIAVAALLQAEINERLPAARLEADSTIVVESDRRSLDRTVGNLLDNAARHAAGAAVLVTAEVADGRLSISVADGGPGVPPGTLPHLFDRFYSADSARTGGTGLGLAIAKAHAERLGGTLSVRPNQPTGLIFELVLPVTELLRSRDGPAKPALHHEGEMTTDDRGGAP